MDDDGHAISFKVLRPGTPVRSADGVRLGTVVRVDEATRENIFDGIMVETDAGIRFLDAPEVARIAERAVTTTFPAAEADHHFQVPRRHRRPGLWGRMRARWNQP
jgi:hypothetical protein